MLTGVAFTARTSTCPVGGQFTERYTKATAAPADPFGHVRADHALIGWTVNEIRRLFNTFVISTARDTDHRLRWSIWRTWHRTCAR